MTVSDTLQVRALQVVAAAALAIGVVGCADDGPTAIAPVVSVVPAVTAAPTVEAVDGDASAPGVPVEPTGVVVEVVAIDNTFRPEAVEIDVGDEVLFVNRGRNEHDALSVDGDDWGVHVEDFGPGAEYRHVFTEPGEYRYYCSIHGTSEVGMVGTVIVRG